MIAVLILLTCVTVFAENASRSEDFPIAGITLNFTSEFENTKGVIVPYGGDEIGSGTGVYETDLVYFALSQEEFDSLSDPFLEGSYAVLLTIISADNGMTFDELSKFAGGSLDPALFPEICTVEDCTHFLYDDPDSALPEGTDAAYVEEFGNLKNAVDGLLANSEFGKPKNPMESMIGKKIAFETTDIEGNPITSEELFGAHEITMVNIWATWCGYCIDEMEELEAISGRLAEKDCAVVGLLSDGDEEAALASGKEILKEKGVTYTNILPPENLGELFYIPGYPTTYFINCEGVIVGTPIVGAYINQYEPAAEALLAEDTSVVEDIQESGEEEEQGEQEEEPLMAFIDTNGDSVYRVIVIDEDGNPIPEVKIQFCSDSTCMTGETDETGTAVFQEEKGHYTAHILKAPEEYDVIDSEFTLEEFCDLTIILYRRRGGRPDPAE